MNKHQEKKPERIYNKDRIRRIKEAAEQTKNNDPNWFKDAPASVLPDDDDEVKAGGMKTPPFLKANYSEIDDVISKKLTLNELTQCNKDSTQVQSIISGNNAQKRSAQVYNEQPNNNLEMQRQKKLIERENYNKQLAENLDKASEKWHYQLKELGKNKNIQDSTGVQSSLFDDEDNEREKYEKESSEKNQGSRKFNSDYASRLDILLQRGLRNSFQSKSMSNLRGLNERSFSRWSSKFDSLSSISDLKYNLLNNRLALGVHSNYFTPPVKPHPIKSANKRDNNHRSLNRLDNIETNLYAQTLTMPNIMPVYNNSIPPYQQTQMFIPPDPNLYSIPQPYYQQPVPGFNNLNSNGNINFNNNLNNNPFSNPQNFINTPKQLTNQFNPNLANNINGNNYNLLPQLENQPNFSAWSPNINYNQQYGNCYPMNIQPPFNMQTNPHNGQFFNATEGSMIPNNQEYFNKPPPEPNQPYDTVFQRINDLANKLDKLNATVDNLSWNSSSRTKPIIKQSNTYINRNVESPNPSASSDPNKFHYYNNKISNEPINNFCNCTDCNMNMSNSSMKNTDNKRVHFKLNDNQYINDQCILPALDLQVINDSEIKENTKAVHPMSVQKRFHDNSKLSEEFSKFELPNEAISLMVSNVKKNYRN